MQNSIHSEKVLEIASKIAKGTTQTTYFHGSLSVKFVFRNFIPTRGIALNNRQMKENQAGNPFPTAPLPSPLPILKK